MALTVRSRPVDVSVVVVAWNSAAWIGRSVSSVAAACGELEHETIVWDNRSADATVAVAREALGDARGEVVESAANDGFAGGVNRAVARAHGRFVLLLNPDCELEPGSVATLVARLEARPDVAGAAPLLVGADGAPQREFQLRRFPTLRSFVAEALMVERLFGPGPEINRYRCRDLDLSVEQPVEQPAAAALLLRRELFDSIGPFDERFSPAWFEDVDFCKRIASAGGVLLLVPSARALHHGGSSLGAMAPGEFVAIWYRNLWRYAEKWLTPDERELLRLAVAAGAALRGAAVAAGFGPREGRAKLLVSYAGVVRSAWSRWRNESRSY